MPTCYSSHVNQRHGTSMKRHVMTVANQRHGTTMTRHAIDNTIEQTVQVLKLELWMQVECQTIESSMLLMY